MIFTDVSFFTELAEGLKNKYPAAKICGDVGLCQNSTLVVKPELMVKLQEPKPEGQIECQICSLIVGYAEDELTANSTVAEIEHFLTTKVCGLLPSFLKDGCNDLVSKYLPELAEGIEKKEPPTKVCTQIGLCSSSVHHEEEELFEHPRPQESIECTICNLVVSSFLFLR